MLHHLLVDVSDVRCELLVAQILVGVCSAHSGGNTLRNKQQHGACVDLSLSNAVARVDRPELTEYVTSQYSVEKKAPARSRASAETSSALRCDAGLTTECGGRENASAALFESHPA
jgi:hypothetical protein